MLKLIPPGSPVLQPIGAVHLVLVEQVRQPLAQLVQLALFIVLFQKALQACENRVREQVGQQAHQPPAQRGLVQRRGLRRGLRPQHPAIHLPQKARRQLHIQRRGNAAAAVVRVFGQRQFQPLSDAVALHQQHFVFQRAQRVGTHPLHRKGSQFF